MSRRLEQRVIYDADLMDEWGPADEETSREARRRCRTDNDFRLFVREWNADAKARGDNTRIRSINHAYPVFCQRLATSQTCARPKKSYVIRLTPQN